MKTTKKMALALAGASLAAMALASTTAAAGPYGQGGMHGGQARTWAQGQGGGAQAGGDVVASILGLTQAQIREMRQSGMSLAQIAQKQGVDPQKLVDALVARWSTRIDYRASVGAITSAQAAELKSQLTTRAKDMAYRTTPGGMRGLAVGAGRGHGAR